MQGDDILFGGEGNDFLVGGGGARDAMWVSGTVNDYSFDQLDADSFSVDGLDGTDTTFGVEYIYFTGSGEWYRLSDIAGGPVDNPYGMSAMPLPGGDKVDNDAQVLPGAADDRIEASTLPELFSHTGRLMATDDASGPGQTYGGLGHDDYWLF